MKFQDHAKSSQNKFGKPFFEVHKYIDQFYKELGIGHRFIFHHKLGIELIVDRFGEDVRKAAELHIREDTDGDLPEDWSYYGEPLFLKLEDYARLSKILLGIYGEDTFRKVSQKQEL